MKKSKLFTSKKNIINIREYLYSTYGIEYTWEGKLTHLTLRGYLKEKDESLPIRISFDKVDNEEILRGECYLVKDEEGKILAYRSKCNFNRLLNELQKEIKKNVLITDSNISVEVPLLSTRDSRKIKKLSLKNRK